MEGAPFRDRIRRALIMIFSISAFLFAVGYLHVEDSDSDETTLAPSEYASEAASIVRNSYSNSDLVPKDDYAPAASSNSGAEVMQENILVEECIGYFRA